MIIELRAAQPRDAWCSSRTTTSISPHDHPRLRHLAEHAATAVRGVGHERDEGRGQRRAEPLGARRLVGGGYDPAYGWAIEGVTDEADRSSSTSCSSSRSSRGSQSRDAWLEMMKSSIAALAPRFSMQRTVIEYAERYYVPAARGA